jgi:hypothetical protein
MSVTGEALGATGRKRTSISAHSNLDIRSEKSSAGHVPMDNRQGLAVGSCVNQATGRAEPQEAIQLVEELPRENRVTLVADRGYDRKELIQKLPDYKVTPYIACKKNSIIDACTTRHPGYAISQNKRKRMEKIIGWLKTVAGLRKTHCRGYGRKLRRAQQFNREHDTNCTTCGAWGGMGAAL